MSPSFANPRGPGRLNSSEKEPQIKVSCALAYNYHLVLTRTLAHTQVVLTGSRYLS